MQGAPGHDFGPVSRRHGTRAMISPGTPSAGLAGGCPGRAKGAPRVSRSKVGWGSVPREAVWSADTNRMQGDLAK